MILQTEKFSIWADFIERTFLEESFSTWIHQGIVNGATSNPAIFRQAFSSNVYDNQKNILHGLTPKEMYEELAATDIRRCCDILLPLYEKGDDGFASWEVDPLLCDDKEETIKEAHRLWNKINRPNLMIKIPATNAGFQAMEQLAKEGMNINATLVFSPEQARKCALALAPFSQIHSVISVFVSRFDRAVDPLLPQTLQGLLGIANAAACYDTIESFSAPTIKTLFASTGVKGNNLSASYYIDTLIGRKVVNTAPIDTINAWIQHGSSDIVLPAKVATHHEIMAIIQDNGVNMATLYETLLNEGIEQFKVAFNEILTSLKD